MTKVWRKVNSRDDFPNENIVGLWAMPYTTTNYKGDPYTIDGQFTIHRNLSLVKACVTNGDRCRRGVLDRTWRVYELAGGAWVEIYEIPQGSVKDDHELWAKGPAPKGKQSVSEDDVQAAIDSIRGVT